MGNWVRIWRKQHPDSGMVEASSDQVAENKRLQAELREAKTEGSSSEIKRRPSSRRNPGSSEICLYTSARKAAILCI